MAGLLDFLFGQGGQGLLGGYGGPAYPNGGGAVDPSSMPAMGGTAMAQATPAPAMGQAPAMQQGAPQQQGFPAIADNPLAAMFPAQANAIYQRQMMQAAMQGLMSKGMSFPQAMITMQNPQVQRDVFGVQSLGAGKTPGGYEGQIVNNGGRVGMAFPTANGQAPTDAGVRSVKPGESLIDLSQPTAGAQSPGIQAPPQAPGAGPQGTASPGKTLYQNTTGMFDPQTVDYYANYVRKSGDQSIFQNLGRSETGALNVAAVRQRIAQLDAKEGVTPLQTASKTAEFSGYKAGQETAARRLANASLAINEAQALIPQALDASSKVPLQSQFKSLNALSQAALEHSGDPNVVQLSASLYGLVHAYARAVNPQGISAEGDMKHATSILDQSLAKNQLGAGIAQIYKEMQAIQSSPGAVKEQMRNEFTGQKGGSDAADALLQGKLAISQGAKREAVMKRLMEKGIDPNGL